MEHEYRFSFLLPGVHDVGVLVTRIMEAWDAMREGAPGVEVSLQRPALAQQWALAVEGDNLQAVLRVYECLSAVAEQAARELS